MNIEDYYEDLAKLISQFDYVKVYKKKNTINFEVEFSPSMHMYPNMHRSFKKKYTHSVYIHPDKSYTLIDTIRGGRITLLDRLKEKHIGDLNVEGYRYENPNIKPLKPIKWDNKELKMIVDSYLKTTDLRKRSDDWKFFSKKYDD